VALFKKDILYMLKFRPLAYAASAAAMALLAACGQPQPAPETNASPAVTAESATATQEATSTVVTAATADPRFTTLVSAINTADLGGTLSGEGPFTVFAPTNEAFAAVEQDVQALLANPDKAPLQRVLTYHVVPGRIMAADLAGQTATPATVAGPTLPVRASGDSVQVGGATVTQADIVVGNGVIHVIDRVLLPPTE
jgi:uncharacterized surface protein with fasciclin (FAS1) repeats